MDTGLHLQRVSLKSTYSPREVALQLPYLSANNFLHETGALGVGPQGTAGIVLPIRETGVFGWGILGEGLYC